MDGYDVERRNRWCRAVSLTCGTVAASVLACCVSSCSDPGSSPRRGTTPAAPAAATRNGSAEVPDVAKVADGTRPTAASDGGKPRPQGSPDAVDPVGNAEPGHVRDEFPPLAALPETPPIPGDNPLSAAKVALGRLLFFDPRLSGDTGTSCATCHDPLAGWGDGNALSFGYKGTEHWRNSQTIVNSAYLSKLFWAGESPSLETQADSAIQGSLAGNGDPTMIEERLSQIPEYVRLFREAFGVGRPAYPLVLKAIASFERSEFNSIDSPFDRYMRGEKSALTNRAMRGMRLFEGKARCIRCHNGPLLTDESFHNLGVPTSPLFQEDPLYQISLRYQFYSRGVPEAIYRSASSDLGLYYTTKRPADMGKFRTPPLRYLAFTDPYMHNGLFSTLDEVIDFYNAGGGSDPLRSPLLEPLGLSDDEKRDLLAFLRALSGSEITLEEPELPPYRAWD